MAKTDFITPKRHPRKLEELNLIDDFLFQQMLSQEETGAEFVKLLLGTILGKTIRNVKIIPQKTALGIDTDHHGIRMDAYIEVYPDEMSAGQELLDAKVQPDIYDIEPNSSYEKKSLPKRMRYYHGLIDTQLLDAGVGYENLPNVIIIIILPYDPFDKNRMVYTIQNQCIEDPSMSYEDGATKIFLYTRGTEGKPSQELRDMLKYIEKTTNENVTNQTIETINNLVNKVRQNREVGINYMKSWEYEKMIRDEATREGLAEGRALGLEEGLTEGLKQGIEQGIEQGLEQGFQAFVTLCQEFHLTREETFAKSCRQFQLPPEKTEKYLQKYW